MNKITLYYLTNMYSAPISSYSQFANIPIPHINDLNKINKMMELFSVFTDEIIIAGTVPWDRKDFTSLVRLCYFNFPNVAISISQADAKHTNFFTKLTTTTNDQKLFNKVYNKLLYTNHPYFILPNLQVIEGWEKLHKVVKSFHAKDGYYNNNPGAYLRFLNLNLINVYD